MITKKDISQLKYWIDNTIQGKFEVLGDGAQIFGSAGLVADFRCQWVDDSNVDSIMAKEDDRIMERNAEMICWIWNHLEEIAKILDDYVSAKGRNWTNGLGEADIKYE